VVYDFASWAFWTDGSLGTQLSLCRVAFSFSFSHFAFCIYEQTDGCMITTILNKCITIQTTRFKLRLRHVVQITLDIYLLGFMDHVYPHNQPTFTTQKLHNRYPPSMTRVPPITSPLSVPRIPTSARLCFLENLFIASDTYPIPDHQYTS
jgi:hypothetical protein